MVSAHQTRCSRSPDIPVSCAKSASVHHSHRVSTRASSCSSRATSRPAESSWRHTTSPSLPGRGRRSKRWRPSAPVQTPVGAASAPSPSAVAASPSPSAASPSPSSSSLTARSRKWTTMGCTAGRAAATPSHSTVPVCSPLRSQRCPGNVSCVTLARSCTRAYSCSAPSSFFQQSFADTSAPPEANEISSVTKLAMFCV